MKRIRILGGAVALLAVATTVVAATGAGGALFGGGGPDAVPSASGLPPATAKVARTTLVQTEQVSGTLSHGTPVALPARSNGTLTWMPPDGSVVKLGKPAYKVNNEPVILLKGTLPAYRTLKVGVEGADVKQFEQNLKSLGYKGFDVDDSYTYYTAQAVEDWQDDLGKEETGKVGVGDILYATGDIRVAVPQASVGAPIGNGTTVYTYSGTKPLVTVALDAAKQNLVSKGISATITLPGGKTAQGKVVEIGTAATKQDGEGKTTTTIAVVLELADPAAAGTLDAAPVDVDLVSETRENVLAVPVAALVALTQGGFGVQAVEGTAVSYIPVKTGMFAGGKVEISGSGITEGVVVGMPK
ncbi:efflux RND transporter periplasmic adaptor subunit [Flindersiella endophytica]